MIRQLAPMIAILLAVQAYAKIEVPELDTTTPSPPLQAVKSPSTTVVIARIGADDAQLIVVRRSCNDTTWSPSLVISDPSEIALARPSLASDHNGHWIAVWPSTTMDDKDAAEAKFVYAESLDHGATWSAPKVITDYRPDDVVVTVKPVPNESRWCVAIRSHDGNSQHAVCVTYAGIGAGDWTVPEIIYRERDTPSKDVPFTLKGRRSDDGALHVAWTVIRRNPMQVLIFDAIRTPGQSSWNVKREILRYPAPNTDKADPEPQLSATTYAISAVLAFYLAAGAAYASRRRWAPLTKLAPFRALSMH